MEIDWNIIFVFAVVAHAIGHTLGLIHTFELINLSGMPTNESWLLTGQLKLDQTVIRVISVLWIVVIIGFLIIAGAFWFELSWWKILAIPMIILSVTLFVVWFNSFPISTPIGAIIGNIVIFVGLFQFN
ncbi:MAG: hypothetical protein JSV04_06465 [Candidatus Heimdallarchaeota archaeon]|nr:MAG: hypothetical protein JSV04_06465 [Candidatus Heimdallarchaeota archaeon]